MTVMSRARDRGADRARLVDFFAEYGFVVFFVIWVVYLSIATDTFLTERNLLLLLRQASIYGIPAIGATFVILLGGFGALARLGVGGGAAGLDPREACDLAGDRGARRGAVPQAGTGEADLLAAARARCGVGRDGALEAVLTWVRRALV